MPLPVGVKVGDTVVAVGRVQNNVGTSYEDGQEFIVAHLDPDEDCIAVAPVEDVGCDTWFYVDDFAATWNMIDNVFVIKAESESVLVLDFDALELRTLAQIKAHAEALDQDIVVKTDALRGATEAKEAFTKSLGDYGVAIIGAGASVLTPAQERLLSDLTREEFDALPVGQALRYIGTYDEAHNECFEVDPQEVVFIADLDDDGSIYVESRRDSRWIWLSPNDCGGSDFASKFLVIPKGE